MKLLSSIAPHIKFTWVAVGLLGALAASLALRRRTLLPGLPNTSSKTSPAETSPTRGITVHPAVTEKDRRLKEQVESAINRALSVKGSLLIEANDGEVKLLGQALAMDLPGVIEAAKKVPGVRTLVNELEVYDVKEIAPELTRPRQTHRDSEIPTAPRALDIFDEDAKFERKF